MIDKHGAEDKGMNEDIDYEKAAGYCNSILKNCPLAINYMCLRIEFLLKSSQLSEADKFSKEVLDRSELPSNSRLNCWRARVVLYNGNEVLGKKMLTQCLQQDPDNVDAQKALKMIKTATTKKEQASEAFK